ncbi:MAG: hypothetical protein PCFJNLEI_03259 [Verrucomicrobiae bacterium]|nr:hypothetical protein [Verrucomicrobiae bacterium]
MQFFNHYSVVIVGVLLLIFSRRLGWRVLTGIAIVYVVGWLIFRPVATPVTAVAGQPLLLEVQSPFCFGCVAVKPVVDRLENELRDKLAVRRVDIQSAEGRQLLKQYAIEVTPTFILFDATAKEQWRGTGTLDAEVVRRLVDAKK